jgi:hypothetical protein
MAEITDSQFITWFSRLLRWTIGLVFIITGIVFYHKDGWTAILFGLLIFITGFLKPRYCLNKHCTSDQEKHT